MQRINRMQQRKKSSIVCRLVIMSMAALYFITKPFHKFLLPHGSPVDYESRKSFAHFDRSNDSLQIKHGRTKRIYERLDGQEPLMVGPETIVFGKDGTLYILSDQGNLVSMTDFKEQDGDEGSSSTITAKATLIKNLGMGRPLSGRFTSDGKTLYITDAFLGLTRIQNIHDPKSKVQLVASSFVDANNEEHQILYANDLCIGPKSGKVYFTDSSNVTPDRDIATHTFDTMYAAKVDLLRAQKTGRLLEYDPATDTVNLLVDNMHFANGVAVGDSDETYLIFAETFAPRIWKYYLKGEKQGTLEVMVENKDMIGYPDGVDCSWDNTDNKNDVSSSGGSSNKCYAALPSTIVSAHKLLSKVPDSIDVLLRTIMLLLPKRLAPKTVQFGAVLELDPESKQFRYIQDPTGHDVTLITGVTRHQNKLYLGSLNNNYIAVYDLNQASLPKGASSSTAEAS
jgi:Strictosidine synthase